LIKETGVSRYKFIEDNVPIRKNADDSSDVLGYGRLHQEVESDVSMLNYREVSTIPDKIRGWVPLSTVGS
jgi:hypothetical protein